MGTFSPLQPTTRFASLADFCCPTHFFVPFLPLPSLVPGYIFIGPKCTLFSRIYLCLGNLIIRCCRLPLELNSLWASSSSFVGVDCVRSRIKSLRGLDSSHILNILTPSYNAVNKKVAKHTPTRAETKK